MIITWCLAFILLFSCSGESKYTGERIVHNYWKYKGDYRLWFGGYPDGSSENGAGMTFIDLCPDSKVIYAGDFEGDRLFLGKLKISDDGVYIDSTKPDEISGDLFPRRNRPLLRSFLDIYKPVHKYSVTKNEEKTLIHYELEFRTN